MSIRCPLSSDEDGGQRNCLDFRLCAPKPAIVTSILRAAKNGGANRDRTDDLKLAKLALSQLSYGPVVVEIVERLVGLGRLELPTSRLSSARSNQLSYKPDEASSQQDAIHDRAADGNRKGNEGGGKSPIVYRRCLGWLVRDPKTSILRKEVIQPQVPLRLPCYDFGPVADPTVAGCLLAVSAPS